MTKLQKYIFIVSIVVCGVYGVLALTTLYNLINM